MNAYQNFSISSDERNVVTVTLDVPDRPLNVLTREVMAELDQIVRDLEHNNEAELVMFQSGKESGFLAGADVSVISQIESPQEASRLIETGQLLFQRIEWLPMPTMAVIHGPCLGGGLELSLACTYRVARNNSSTKIGLPEIKLGLIPGWGGTQRLPKLVGPGEALKMILTGKDVGAAEAMKIGLVDVAIDPGAWQTTLDGFVDEVLHDEVISGRPRGPRWRRLMERSSLGRSLLFRITEKSIRSKSKLYPALPAALRAVRAGYGKKPEGMLVERSEFIDLLATPTCRSLIGLFFARERARKLATWTPSASTVVHEAPIRRVGVVGAGAMGAGIGQLAAVRGYNVVMKEVNDEASAAGAKRIEKLVNDLAKRKGWSKGKRFEVIGRIAHSSEDQSLSACDLVIEAVVERDDVKASVFGMLDQVVKPSGLLASNTSSLSVTKMAEATERPAKVAGLHFFNPVHRMELVEVVRAKGTEEATIAKLVAFVKALGKTPIVTSDSPGFLVNRVLFPYLGEAILMVSEGHSPTEIDKQVRQFGMPMGPIELLDQVGLDVAMHVAGSLDSVLSGTEPIVEYLQAMVEKGWLGKKSKQGFYLYKRGKRVDVNELPSSSVKAVPMMADDFIKDGLTSIQRRLVYPMLCEAIRCHEESVVEEPWAIDLAMVLGTGFAPSRGGPLHVVDAIGLDHVRQNSLRLQRVLGERFAPPKELVEMSEHGETFFGEHGPTREKVEM